MEKKMTPQMAYYYSHKEQVYQKHLEYLRKKNNAPLWASTRDGVTTITIRWEDSLELNEQIKERSYWLKALKEYKPIIDVEDKKATIMYLKVDNATQKSIEERLKTMPICKNVKKS